MLSLRSAFSIQILTQIQMVRHQRPVSVVNLDHGWTSTVRMSFVADNVGQKHCAQEYEDRSELLREREASMLTAVIRDSGGAVLPGRTVYQPDGRSVGT